MICIFNQILIQFFKKIRKMKSELFLLNRNASNKLLLCEAKVTKIAFFYISINFDDIVTKEILLFIFLLSWLCGKLVTSCVSHIVFGIYKSRSYQCVLVHNSCHVG